MVEMRKHVAKMQLMGQGAGVESGALRPGLELGSCSHQGGAGDREAQGGSKSLFDTAGGGVEGLTEASQGTGCFNKGSGRGRLSGSIIVGDLELDETSGLKI